MKMEWTKERTGEVLRVGSLKHPVASASYNGMRSRTDSENTLYRGTIVLPGFTGGTVNGKSMDLVKASIEANVTIWFQRANAN